MSHTAVLRAIYLDASALMKRVVDLRLSLNPMVAGHGADVELRATEGDLASAAFHLCIAARIGLGPIVDHAPIAPQ